MLRTRSNTKSQRSDKSNPNNKAGDTTSRGQTIRKESELAKKTGLPVKLINSDVEKAVLMAENRQSRSRGGEREKNPPIRPGENTVGLPENDGNTKPERINTGNRVRVPRESSGFRTNPDGSKTLFTLGPRISRGGTEYDQMQSRAPRVRSSNPITQKQLENDMFENPELYQQSAGFQQPGFLGQIPWNLVLIGAGVLILFRILINRKKK